MSLFKSTRGKVPFNINNLTGDNIGTVDIPTDDDESDPEDPAKHLKNVRVVGVMKLDPYRQCFKCSSKV